MTDKEINVAIAETCGFEEVSHDESGVLVGYLRQENGARYLTKDYVPDYCRDLNAMHDAEDVLDKYYIRCVIMDYELLIDKRSTARQRAEAFLRTVGKWRD